MATLLPRGDWRVRVATPFEGPTCGLVPLGETCVITTKGLKWDVTSWTTAFGGSVSTSNHVEGVVMTEEERGERGGGQGTSGTFLHISTTAPIVWTLVVNADEVIRAAANNVF